VYSLDPRGNPGRANSYEWLRGSAHQILARVERKKEADKRMQDHPGKKCSDAHPGMSHDDFMDKSEEEDG
jgi:hypothetical protein